MYGCKCIIMFQRTVIYTFFILIISGCSHNNRNDSEISDDFIDKTLDVWLNKEINLDYNIGYFTLNGRDTIECVSHTGEFKILRYIDKRGCTQCRFQMQKYSEIIEEFKDSAKTDIDYLCIVATDDIEKLRTAINICPVKLPVWVDMADSINRVMSFPKAYGLQTFLLDKNNRVLVVGDPVCNPYIKELYIDIITNDSINHFRMPETVVICENPKITLGKVKCGDSIKCSFQIKNIGTHDFVSMGITTSCACTHAVLKPDTIRQGETGVIDVTLMEDHSPGEFFRTITLFGNIPTEYSFEITGSVVMK